MIMSKTLLNLDIRFPCPSFSIDMSLARRNVIDTMQQLDESFLKNVQRQCPFFELVGLFLFPDDLINKRQINPIFVNGKYPEVPLISREIVEKEGGSNKTVFIRPMIHGHTTV